MIDVKILSYGEFFAQPSNFGGTQNHFMNYENYQEYAKKCVKEALYKLRDLAQPLGIKYSNNKNGTIGKSSSLSTILINLRKYDIDIGELTIRYKNITGFDIVDNIFIIKTIINTYGIMIPQEVSLPAYLPPSVAFKPWYKVT